MGLFESLKLLSEEVEIRNEIDDFIEEGYKTFKNDWSGKHKWEKNKFFKILESDFNNFLSGLGDRYPNTKLTRDIIIHYFMLDKRLSLNMRRYSGIGTSWGVLFDAELYRYGPYAINGSNIRDIYDYNIKEMIDAFEQNIELLPISLKKYILNKKKEMENLSFDTLENEFQARIFVSKMDDNFKITKFRDVLKNFKKIKEVNKRLITFVNLYNAVDKKYDRNDKKFGENVVSFLDLVAETYLREVNYSFFYGLTSPNTANSLEKFINNANFCNSFARASKNVDFGGHLPLLSYLISNGEVRDEIKQFAIGDMKKKTNGNYVEFKNVSDELINDLFEIAVKQFLSKHPLIRKVFEDNEKISV